VLTVHWWPTPVSVGGLLHELSLSRRGLLPLPKSTKLALVRGGVHAMLNDGAVQSGAVASG
jgi:hypothetical protein